MTAVVISQPMLFPWPGFFEQMRLADVYLILDDVQFSKGSFTNRIQIKHGGAVKWMTIPLQGKGAFQTIQDLKEAGSDWREGHKVLLRQAFAHAPFRNDALAIVDRAYAHPVLCDVLVASIAECAAYLSIDMPGGLARTSALHTPGSSWSRVLDLVEQCAGDRYITGHGAARYLDHAAFEARGVEVDYMRYSLTPWPQQDGEFTPYVSVLDLIANTGPAAAGYLNPATEPWREHLKHEQADIGRKHSDDLT